MAKAIKFQQGAYKEAVDYFRQKINLPTKRWNDLEGAMHTRAFTVAGAMREDILCDFRKAVDSAIANGESLQDFRDNFYKIASKWRASDPSFDEKMKKPKYGAWRSKVIYQTNMLTAAAAAQERQVRDPELKGVFTHAKYVCMMLPGSREEHKRWNGTVLPVNDPWWDKHSPPNGFGCMCEKEFISKYEMNAGIEKETVRNKDNELDPNDTTNIGENWDYSIGESDQGVYWASERAENKAKMEKNKSGWEEVPQSGIWAQDSNSAKNLPVESSKAFAPDYSITKDNFEEKIREILGVKKGDEIYIPFKDTLTGFDYNIHLDPLWLSNHIQGKGKSRHANLPMYLETLRNPSEIRIRFMKSLKTGKCAIRSVFWKRFLYGGENFFVEVVSDANQANEFKIWTNYANNSKSGIMMEGVPIYQKP